MKKCECKLELSALGGYERCPACGHLANEHPNHKDFDGSQDFGDMKKAAALMRCASPLALRTLLDEFDPDGMCVGETTISDLAFLAHDNGNISDMLMVLENVDVPSINARVERMINEIHDPIEKCARELVQRVRELGSKWGPFASTHELESVLREEMTELTSEVFRESKDLARIRSELFDIAAAAMRGIEQIDLDRPFSDAKQMKEWQNE